MTSPHYQQIEQAMRERIAASAPGTRIPSDKELSTEFGVSRMTARHAMQLLAEDGLIRREPGRGSFVATPSPHRRAHRLMTFSQEMRRAGRVPSSRVLTRVLRSSTAEEAQALGIDAGDHVVHLRRLRLADGAPVALESVVLIAATADAVTTADLETGSLHHVLASAGYVLRRGSGSIGADVASATDADLLGVTVGSPLLVERRVIVDAHGRRIEATESRYRADSYRIDVRFDVEGQEVTGG